MKTRLCLSFLVLLSAAAILASPVELLSKAEVLSIDRTELRFHVKMVSGGETRVLQVTSQTRFLLDGKYAISEDVQPGDFLSGKVHKRADGSYEAVRLVITKPKVPPLALALWQGSR